MPNMDLLKDKIDDSGMKMIAVASKSGIERATLYNRLNGKGEWTISEMLGMSEALHLSKAEREQIFLS